MEVLHHIIYKVMDIQGDEEIQSFKHWMKTEILKLSLKCVMLSLTCWTIFMITMNTNWMLKICPEIWHHEQDQVVHQMDVHKYDRQHF